MPYNRTITCPWCEKVFELDPKYPTREPLVKGHIAGCKAKHNGVEIWCPSCMANMYVKAYEADQAICPACGKKLTCKCGKPAKYICACGHLDCGYHPCPKNCGEVMLAEGLLKGLRPLGNE